MERATRAGRRLSSCSPGFSGTGRSWCIPNSSFHSNPFHARTQWRVHARRCRARSSTRCWPHAHAKSSRARRLSAKGARAWFVLRRWHCGNRQEARYRLAPSGLDGDETTSRNHPAAAKGHSTCRALLRFHSSSHRAAKQFIFNPGEGSPPRFRWLLRSIRARCQDARITRHNLGKDLPSCSHPWPQ